MQEVQIYLANERPGLAIFSTVVGHNFGFIAVNDFGMMLRGKRPHKSEFAHDFVGM